jgi:hypothetical protein
VRIVVVAGLVTLHEGIAVRDAVTVTVMVAVVRIQTPRIFGIVRASFETLVVAVVPLMRQIVVRLLLRTARLDLVDLLVRTARLVLVVNVVLVIHVVHGVRVVHMVHGVCVVNVVHGVGVAHVVHGVCVVRVVRVGPVVVRAARTVDDDTVRHMHHVMHVDLPVGCQEAYRDNKCP